MDGAQRPIESLTLPELVSQLAIDLTTLVRKESELVRTELTEKVHHATRAAGEIAAGGVLLVAALLVLLQALVMALSTVIGPIWAALAVGVVVAALGLLLVRNGRKLLRPDALAPKRSARQLQKDAQLLKGH